MSFSQLARSSSSRPPGCFETLVADLVAQAQGSADLSPWSQHGKATPGVRLHVGYAMGRSIPTRLRLVLPDTNDHEALRTWDLAPWRGWTVLIDLGYYGHGQFARLRDAEVSFLSRLHPQARYAVTDDRPVPVKATPEGDLVLRDETITLGSPNNRHGMVIPGLRLIHRRNRGGCERAFVTDRFDLTAFQLVRLYRYRWQIELFFRSLKHQLGLMVPFGRSAAAVWLSVLVAMIVMLVQALVEALRPAATSRVAWNDGIGMVLIIFLALPDG